MSAWLSIVICNWKVTIKYQFLNIGLIQPKHVNSNFDAAFKTDTSRIILGKLIW